MLRSHLEVAKFLYADLPEAKNCLAFAFAPQYALYDCDTAGAYKFSSSIFFAPKHHMQNGEFILRVVLIACHQKGRFRDRDSHTNQLMTSMTEP
jgi:hypothetical protein